MIRSVAETVSSIPVYVVTAKLMVNKGQQYSAHPECHP